MKTDYINGIPVFRMAESMVSGVNENLSGLYDSIPEKDRSYIILDFTKTNYINSSGLAALIALVSNATDKGHKVDFAGISGHVEKVMGLVGLLEYVDVYPTPEKAVEKLP
jgi:anti-sigma B factor antagonist